MLKILTGALMCVCVAVQASPTSHYDDPIVERDVSKRVRSVSNIVWVLAEDPAARCEELAISFNLTPLKGKVVACSFFSGPEDDTCIVVTKEKVSLRTVGHEVLHCFLGHWH